MRGRTDTGGRRRGRGRGLAAAVAVLLPALAAAAVWLVGCTNDPFDPESIPNQRPVARIWVTPAEGDTLNATSYWRRVFHWSGSDADGYVVEYHVSIRSGTEPATWDTTAQTSRVVSFTTDDEGHAEATIMVACRDDRGAMSDTVSQYVPLRNFPPVINFAADFDTVRWSYGAANFRLFAVDLDGDETLNDTWRYRLDTADTNLVYPPGAPGADPRLGWVTRLWPSDDARDMSIALRDLPPGPERSLEVVVGDEAHAETRFHWTWEVLPAVGHVMLVADVSPSVDTFYAGMMDSVLGPANWSLYPMRQGLPDDNSVLTWTFGQFDAVVWYTGVTTSAHLVACEPVLASYLAAGGRFLFVSPVATGQQSSGLSQDFLEKVIGIERTASTGGVFYAPAGKRALARVEGLPDIASTASYASGMGLLPRSGTEELWRMEYCRACYSPREPYDPIVGVRRPARPLPARAVTISLGLNWFDRAAVRDALRAVLFDEMGVPRP